MIFSKLSRSRLSISSGLLLAACILCASCAPHVLTPPPDREGIDLRDELIRRGGIAAIDATFTIELEKDGSTMKGDAVLRLTQDDLNLRIYSLGFLASEIDSRGGLTKSVPPIEGTRLQLLVDGIRSSFLWWSIEDYKIDEGDAALFATNSWRRIEFNKRTLLPERQEVLTPDGREIKIVYEDPRPIGGEWFPLKMRIGLYPYSVSIAIKDFSYTSADLK
jgi:hypothetical protein